MTTELYIECRPLIEPPAGRDGPCTWHGGDVKWLTNHNQQAAVGRWTEEALATMVAKDVTSCEYTTEVFELVFRPYDAPIQWVEYTKERPAKPPIAGITTTASEGRYRGLGFCADGY